MPEWVLEAFQLVGQEQLAPAGTELENTLAESHFLGEHNFSTLSILLWQQTVLAGVPASFREAICFPTATRKGAALRWQEPRALPGPPVREASAGDHTAFQL